jgi:hypothetical protein
MFKKLEEGRVRSQIVPSLCIFYRSKEIKLDGIFIFRESEKSLKETPKSSFFHIYFTSLKER